MLARVLEGVGCAQDIDSVGTTDLELTTRHAVRRAAITRNAHNTPCNIYAQLILKDERNQAEQPCAVHVFCRRSQR